MKFIQANVRVGFNDVKVGVVTLGYVIVTQRTKKNVLGILKNVYLQCDRSGEYKSASKSKTHSGIYLRFLSYIVVPIFLIMISLFRNTEMWMSFPTNGKVH